MNFNIDESKIVKVVVEGDNDNLIGFDIKGGIITGATIIPKKKEPENIKSASNIDRELINKSYDIVKQINNARSIIRHTNEIVDPLDIKISQASPYSVDTTDRIMEDIRVEAEKDFEEAWAGTETPNEHTDLGSQTYKPVEFQEGVTEKEQQILDTISETPIDKLADSEDFLRKIGEYKNLMKSKITKAEASKKLNGRLNYG